MPFYYIAALSQYNDPDLGTYIAPDAQEFSVFCNIGNGNVLIEKPSVSASPNHKPLNRGTAIALGMPDPGNLSGLKLAQAVSAHFQK